MSNIDILTSKKISWAGLFPRIFFYFLCGNPQISGYFDPQNNFWGPEQGIQDLPIYYLYNFRGGEGKILGAMAPLGPL